jgi:hypothetical protein
VKTLITKRRADLTATVVVPWCVAVVMTGSLAARTGSVVVWAACALILGMGALILMVLAHSPAKTIAEILRDVETR